MSSKRIFGKGWFLTYPRCPLPKEEVYQTLSKKFKITDYVVAEETHQDGTPHIHAFVKLQKRMEFKPTLFDIGTYHGNYQVAKSWRAVAEYCTKEESYLTNINIKELKQGKHVAKNRIIQEKPLKDLVDEGIISIRDVPVIKKAKEILQLELPPFEAEDVRGIWLHGEPGTGKTTFARTEYGEVFIKQQNKWFDGYANQENIVLDDLDTDCLGHYIKIWADKWPASGEVKGGTINLQHKRFIITSNYRPDQLFKDPVMCKAIERRFKIIQFNKNI